MTDFNPGFQSEGSYSPDRLIAGDHPLRTIGVTIATGQNLQRGALLGTDGTNYLLSLAAAADGSETPVAVLGEDVDATGGAAQSFAYVAGDFNANAMTFGTGHTADSVREGLRAHSIYLHDAVPA
jgi:hypothetical protein